MGEHRYLVRVHRGRVEEILPDPGPLDARYHFPMSENYPVFKPYLVQALERIEARLTARVS